MRQTQTIKDILIDIYRMKEDIHTFIRNSNGLIEIPEDFERSSKRYAEALVVRALLDGYSVSTVKSILLHNSVKGVASTLAGANAERCIDRNQSLLREGCLKRRTTCAESQVDSPYPGFKFHTGC